MIDPNETCAICLETWTEGVEASLSSTVCQHHYPPKIEKNVGIFVFEEDFAAEQCVVDNKPNKIKVIQKPGSDYLLRLGCGHVAHADCIKQRVHACNKRNPNEKFTFGHMTCAVCRSDLTVTDPNQGVAKRMLRDLLNPTHEIRARVHNALWKHAMEDPVDKIPGLDAMSQIDAEAQIQRRIGAFQCSKCNDIFCEGIECAVAEEAEGTSGEERILTCPSCVFRPLMGPADYSKCPEPLYKCDLCCSVAKYRCPDYYQCEKHHSGPKTLELCPGDHKCPLGIVHPQNAHVRAGFIIGCGCGKCK